MNITEASLFWGFLVVYGVVMYVLSPKSKTANSFYRGADDQGNPVGQWSLTASIFISWIFAKSVTNAANHRGITPDFVIQPNQDRRRKRQARQPTEAGHQEFLKAAGAGLGTNQVNDVTGHGNG